MRKMNSHLQKREKEMAKAVVVTAAAATAARKGEGGVGDSEDCRGGGAMSFAQASRCV